MDPATFKLTGWRLVQPINFIRPTGGRRYFRHSDGGGGAGRLGTEFRSGCGATSVQGKLLSFDCFPQHAPVA